MAKVKIVRQDGAPTPYFYWSNEAERDPTKLQVYKSASHGVERMKGIFFNKETNSIRETEVKPMGRPELSTPSNSVSNAGGDRG